MPICTVYYWQDGRTDVHLDGCGWAEGNRWTLTHVPLTWKSRLVPTFTIWEFQRQRKHAPCFLDSRFYIVSVACYVLHSALPSMYLSPVWSSSLACLFCNLYLFIQSIGGLLGTNWQEKQHGAREPEAARSGACVSWRASSARSRRRRSGARRHFVGFSETPEPPPPPPQSDGSCQDGNTVHRTAAPGGHRAGDPLTPWAVWEGAGMWHH